MEGIPAFSREGEGLGPLSVTATVEVCQPRREGDRWRQLRGQRPATLSSQRGGEEEEVEEGGFHLEQLPTTYTNKRAIMGAQWERRRRGRERPHHGKYVMLGERSSWQVSTVSQTMTYSLFCVCVCHLIHFSRKA